MEVVPGDRVEEGMTYLDWNITRERENGLQRSNENVWSRFRDMEEKYFVQKFGKLIESTKDHKPDQTMARNFQNLLNNFKKNLFCFSKESSENKVAVVGAGKIFTGLVGKGNIKDLIRSVILLWIEKIKLECQIKGVQRVCEEWIAAENMGKGLIARKKLNMERSKENDIRYIEAKEEFIVPEVKECFEQLSQESEQNNINLSIGPLRTRCRNGSKKHVPENHRREKKTLISLISNLKYCCLLENNQVVSQLFVFYDKMSWEADSVRVRERILSGLEEWPFISLDSEGKGAWYQVGYYARAGWECICFCAFFPEDLMELLESNKTILTGKDVHTELG